MKRACILILLAVSLAGAQTPYTSRWKGREIDTAVGSARGFYPLTIGRYVPMVFYTPTSGRPFWQMNSHHNSAQANDIVLSMYHNITFDSTTGFFATSKPFPGVGAFAMQYESHYDSAMEWNASAWTASENPSGGFYRRIFHMNFYNSAVSGINPGQVTWRWWVGRHSQFAAGYDPGGPLFSSGGNIDSTKASFFSRGSDVGMMLRNYDLSGRTSLALIDSNFGYLKLQQFGDRRTDSLYGIPMAGNSSSQIINYGFGNLFIGTNSAKSTYFNNNGSLTAEFNSGGFALYRQSLYWYAYNPLLQMTSSEDPSRTALLGVYGSSGQYRLRYTYDIHIWPRYISGGGKVLIGDSTAVDSTLTVNGGISARGGGAFGGPVTASNGVGTGFTGSDELLAGASVDSIKNATKGDFSFSGSNVRTAVYIPGATTASRYAVWARSTDGTTLPSPNDLCVPFSKTDSLVVIRPAGTTSDLVGSYLRTK